MAIRIDKRIAVTGTVIVGDDVIAIYEIEDQEMLIKRGRVL